jgi:PST family polysaccharide transporter
LKNGLWKWPGLRYLKHDLVRNVIALYGVQACRKILPLITIPYAARVLQPAGWGRYALMASLGEFMVIIIEFGFNLSATREIARNRHLPDTCGEIAASVFFAQGGLSFVAIAFALTAAAIVPSLRQDPAMLAAALLYGLAQGLNPLWFFQGLERMRMAAGLEITGKILGLIGIFIFVRSPQDGWRVLALQTAAPLLSTTAGIFLACRWYPLRKPSASHLVRAFQNGWNLFLFRGGESLYGIGNSLILGFFAPASSVGYFTAAERLSKASFGLLNPIRESLYPRLSHLAGRSADKAAHLAKIGATVMIAGGVALAVVIWILAPLMVRIVMGPGFEPAVPVLRVLSLLPPLLAVTYSVGLQWLLPLGRDKQVNRIILSAGILNVLLAFIFAPRFAHLGMAWAVLLSEVWVACLMCWTVYRLRGPRTKAIRLCETEVIPGTIH